MRLLLICDEGHSSSILKQRVGEAVERSGLAITVDYGGVRSGTAELGRADTVLIAPQVGHRQRDLEERLDRPLALGVIPRRLFGALDADAILALAIDLHDAYGELRRAWEIRRDLSPREVLVCCSGGNSSSLLVWFMGKAADAMNLHVHIVATSVGEGKFHMGEADCALIAPQVRFEDILLEQFNERHIPVGHIPGIRYGRMDGEWVMGEVVRLLAEAGKPALVMDDAYRRRWQQAVETYDRVERETLARRDAIVKAYGKRRRNGGRIG